MSDCILSLFAHDFFGKMFLFSFLSFKIVQLNETHINPREEFERQQQMMIEKRKKIDAEISRRIAEAELADEKETNSGIIEYSDTKILSVEPPRIPANKNQQILISLDPSPRFNGYCKFGSIIRIANIHQSGTVSCTTPILSVGEIYLSYSEDKKKWTIPTLLTIYDPDAPTYSTTNILIFIGICVGAFVVYRLILKGIKKNKGRKHKYDDPMDQKERHHRSKKSKKHTEVLERETV